MKLWKMFGRHNGRTRQIYGNCGQKENKNPVNYDTKTRCRTFSEDSGRNSSLDSSSIYPAFLTTVQLKKKHRESLGIILSSGNSELEPCTISGLRPDSLAAASDRLQAGDRIVSVNGINTSRMRPDEVAHLLDHIDDSALLELEYNLPAYRAPCTAAKLTEITLERIGGSLGVTLRGGFNPDQPHLSHPFVITAVRVGGAAHLAGVIKPGDRLLKVDQHSLCNKTLAEAHTLLQCHSPLTTLTVEYDVSVLDSVRYACGPLLVEIDRQPDEGLGLLLAAAPPNSDVLPPAGHFIHSIVPGSVSDRCGALHPGDQLLAVDDLRLDEWPGSAKDAERLLQTATRLQILPHHALQRANSVFSTLNSRKSRSKRRQSTFTLRDEFCSSLNRMEVYHSETLQLTLNRDPRLGYGLTISEKNGFLTVMAVIPNSPAFRTGCIQPGDRILAINHKNHSLDEAEQLLSQNAQVDLLSMCHLELEFDVADTIVPSSGIFTVKLPKRNPCLGITITSAKSHHQHEPFIISEIKKGSLAHRIGSLHAGDRLLAIDNQSIDYLTLETAFDILQSASKEIVTLKIEKTEVENDNLRLDSVVYTVELHRYGGALGITIAGSEDSNEPIILSRLTEGGLAEKTGALHVGDRLLAINGECLKNRPLSAAIRLLQSSGDRVQLKIARNLQLVASPVDSAIDSWDSNAPEAINDEKESVLSDLSYENFDYKHKHDSQLQFYSDCDEVFCPSPLPLPNYNFGNASNSSDLFMNRLNGTYSNESIGDCEVFHLTLYKDSIYDDYGFSVSDGLYEKGVYINRIRKGGPADIVGLLKAFDRIIQVNDTKTKDFDCCLTVPLIASAGDRIELLIARNPFANYSEKDFQDNISKKSMSSSQNTITKTI